MRYDKYNGYITCLVIVIILIVPLQLKGQVWSYNHDTLTVHVFKDTAIADSAYLTHSRIIKIVLDTATILRTYTRQIAGDSARKAVKSIDSMNTRVGRFDSSLTIKATAIGSDTGFLSIGSLKFWNDTLRVKTSKGWKNTH